MAAPPAPPTVKPNFWRIQNINSSERDEATEWLREQVQELELPEGHGYSLAADSERTLCATLTVSREPTPSKRHWKVDRHFTGFTPLCDPGDTKLDVVAVTGLGGHALGSFRSQEGTSVWLRDFGPEDVPQARFITYGYDTAVADSDSNQGVAELARTLLDGLAIFRRRTLSERRPLCFVCHSLGGVVLKEALVVAHIAGEAEHRRLHEVVLATSGLILLGVPNLGLRHEQLSTVVAGQPNEGFVRDLLTQTDGEASQYLNSLTKSFARICKEQQPPWRIISYYEKLRSHTIAASENGRWTMTGPKEFLVTQDSAERIGHEVRDINHLPSHSDHRNLVRFEHRQDTRYLSVIEQIRLLVVAAGNENKAPSARENTKLTFPNAVVNQSCRECQKISVPEEDEWIPCPVHCRPCPRGKPRTVTERLRWPNVVVAAGYHELCNAHRELKKRFAQQERQRQEQERLRSEQLEAELRLRPPRPLSLNIQTPSISVGNGVGRQGVDEQRTQRNFKNLTDLGLPNNPTLKASPDYARSRLASSRNSFLSTSEAFKPQSAGPSTINTLPASYNSLEAGLAATRKPPISSSTINTLPASYNSREAGLAAARNARLSQSTINTLPATYNSPEAGAAAARNAKDFWSC